MKRFPPFLLFRSSGPSRALKLGAKGKEVDNFVDQLKSEGETIIPTTGKRGSDVSKALPPPVNVERYVSFETTLVSFMSCLEKELKVDAGCSRSPA